MAIALPPPITPQPEPLEEIRAYSPYEVLLDFRGVRVHLSGPLIQAGVVSRERLQKQISLAETPSEAVRDIGYLHYMAGYPATLVSYAVSGDKDLYVRVTSGHVRSVQGPPAIAGYFENLVNTSWLAASDLEHDRTLADALSERGGQSFKPELRPIGGEAVVLDLGEPADTGHQTVAVGEFSNYGNRYAGPYLADAGLRHSFSSGDELSVAGAVSTRFLGLGGSHSEPYHEGDLGWSRVTPFGVFGLQGRYADFQQHVEGGVLDGKLDSAALSWLVPLYADFQHRLNFTGTLDHSDQTIKVQADDTRLLSERYFSVGADLSYLHRIEHDQQRTEIRFELGMRHGLGQASSTETAASQDYVLVRPSFSVRYSTNPHWTFAGEGNFQLSGSTLPQQEQFVIGGPSTLHAYETGVGVGDRGGNLRLSTEWKDTGDSWIARHQLKPRLFAEYGTAISSHGAPDGSTARVALADVGADVEMHLTQWLAGTLSVAQSVYDHGGENSPDGLAKRYVFFQLAAKY